MKKQLIHRLPNQVESWVLNTGNTKLSQAGMMRHKRLINTLAVIVAGSLGLSSFILPPQARSQETGQPCEVALLNAKKRIEQGRDITVITTVTDGTLFDGTKRYPDHPDGRPTIIWLEVDGNAADSVMESLVFQKAIASEIIKSCNSVGAVTDFFSKNIRIFLFSLQLVIILNSVWASNLRIEQIDNPHLTLFADHLSQTLSYTNL